MRDRDDIINDERILSLINEEGEIEMGFRMLLQKYREQLYWHIRRMVKSHEDADDVMQNVMMKVYKSIGGFKGKSKLYTWLYRIASNESITFLKKRNRRASSSIDDEDLNISNRLKAESYQDGDEIVRRLEMAIETLPEKQKMVFNLRYFEEMSYQEMSDVLNTSVGALKSSFHHALKKIETYLREVEI